MIFFNSIIVFLIRKKAQKIVRSGNTTSSLKPIFLSAVNQIFKERMKLVGIEGNLSAHSIRSGFVTSAASGIKDPVTGNIQTIPIWEIMRMSGHKTSRSVDDYYRNGSILKNPASDML